MKIRITGKTLPKAQWNIGTIPTFKGIPNLKNIATASSGIIDDTRDQYGNTVQYDQQGNPIQYDWAGNPSSYNANYTGRSAENYDALPPKERREYDPQIPSLLTAGMAWGNSLISGIQDRRDYMDYAKRLGQTDAGNSPVSNVYSRGRNVMNTGEYAPNQMTPVQFSNRPSPQFTGYPRYKGNQYAQDGATVGQDFDVLRDIIGVYDQNVADPEDYSSPSTKDASSNMMFSQGNYGEQPEFENTSNESQSASSNELALPVQNFKITSGFGNRKAPKAGASTSHNGLDLAVPVNSDVFAPMDGVVKSIYTNDHGGKQLVIQHADGSRSGYAHLNSYRIKVGDRVSKGQVVALSGNTGNSTGPHLHFTFRNAQGNPIDPTSIFNFSGKGTTSTGSKEKQVSLSHNNPMNIHYGDFAAKYGAKPGANDVGGKVAIFPNLQTGIQANKDLLFGSGYNNLTISQARNRWVSGNPNVTNASTSSIVKAMGGDKLLSSLTSSEKDKLFKEFTKWEGSQGYDLIKNTKLFENGGLNTNDMKIKITGTPNNNVPQYADGGRTVGDQMGYGLYRGQGVRDFNAFTQNDPIDSVRSVEPQVSRDKATIEAEAGEKLIAKDGMSIMDIKGKPHSKGGTPLAAEPGSYVVSNYIVGPNKLQEMMGFTPSTGGKKDNTWSKILDRKVKSKDYNRLSELLQQAATGKEVDPFELAAAKNKLPIYKDYISKAALGNELSKAQQGKPFEIPEIGMVALKKLMAAQQGSQEEQMEGPQGQNPQEEQQESPMARYGKTVPQYQDGSVVAPKQGDRRGDEGDYFIYDEASLNTASKGWIPEDIYLGKYGNSGTGNTWTGEDNSTATTAAGSAPSTSVANPLEPWTGDQTTEMGKKNASRYKKEVWIEKLKKLGYAGDYTNKDVQQFLYKNPLAKVVIDKAHTQYGQPTEGMFDGKLGVRWDDALDAASTIPPPVKKTPPNQVNTEWEGGDGSDLKKSFYNQDVVNFANAVQNQYAYPNIGSFRARPGSTYLDPAFTSTEGLDRLLQSQGRTAMEDASLYAGSPQSQAARQQQINAQMIPGLIQNRVQNQQQNVTTDMAARQYNAQVANQAALQDATITSQLAEDNANLAQNIAKEKIAGRFATKEALNRATTNAGDTYLMNQWYPQYAFDPSSYQVGFKKNSGNTVDEYGRLITNPAVDDYGTLYENYLVQTTKAHPNDPKAAADAAEKLTLIHINANKTKTVTTTDPRAAMMDKIVKTQTQTTPQQKSGGFVPQYYAGKLWG